MFNIILSAKNGYDEDEIIIIPDRFCLDYAMHLFNNFSYISLEINGNNDIKWELVRSELKRKI